MAVELFPAAWKDLWDEWQIRVCVLGSLFVQILLTFLGSRRAHSRHSLIKVSLWVAYLLSDWVATLTLGAISNKMAEDGPTTSNQLLTNELLSFWSPFLLLHLGGPDTLTAYALEDNELWLRHFIGLFVQTTATIYIFLISWNGNWISTTSVVVLATGFIKYGERTWVLRSASKEQFRDSMLSPPNPGPDYVKFMEYYSWKIAEGFRHNFTSYFTEQPVEESYPDSHIITEEDIVLHSHDYFKTFKGLFADLVIGSQDQDNSKSFFRKISAENAFKVIEFELRLMFDLLYTKASLLYSFIGRILRFISFGLFLYVLVGFMKFMDGKKGRYSTIEMAITYLLLVVPIFLETCGFIQRLCSDWTIYWLIKYKKYRVVTPIRRLVTFLRGLRHQNKWSNSMGQYNLLSFCIKDNPMIFGKVYKVVPYLHDLLEEQQYKHYEKVSLELKNLIFEKLKESLPKDGSAHGSSPDESKQLWTDRPHWILEKYLCSDILGWSIDMDFDETILIWHIATDICYCLDVDKKRPSNSSNEQFRFLLSCQLMFNRISEFFRSRFNSARTQTRLLFKQILKCFRSTCSKPQPQTETGNQSTGNQPTDNATTNAGLSYELCNLISEYMLYLLITNPSMLPAGIGQIRYRDSCSEATEFFRERKKVIEKEGDKAKLKGCELLLEINSDLHPADVKGYESKSVLFVGCRLAKALQELVEEDRWNVITLFWVNRICLAAVQCRGNYHAQELGHGGELLSHIWLLMAHLGIRDKVQAQMSQSHSQQIVFV